MKLSACYVSILVRIPTFSISENVFSTWARPRAAAATVGLHINWVKSVAACTVPCSGQPAETQRIYIGGALSHLVQRFIVAVLNLMVATWGAPAHRPRRTVATESGYPSPYTHTLNPSHSSHYSQRGRARRHSVERKGGGSCLGVESGRQWWLEHARPGLDDDAARQRCTRPVGEEFPLRPRRPRRAHRPRPSSGSRQPWSSP